MTSKPVIPVVKKILEYRHSGTVLDVGAGEGQNSAFLALQGFDVTALETTNESLENIEASAIAQGTSISTAVGNVLNLPPLKKTFDIVICTSVLHFLTSSEVFTAVRALKSVTKDGGLNVVSVHTDKNENEVRPHLFSEGELRNLYSDWKILHYWEGLGAPFQTRAGETVQRHRAEVIAEKP